MLKEEIKYQDVNPEYEKDRDYEKFLESFNEALKRFEEDRYQNLTESWPNIHVIGVPRSGTTLLIQLICSHLDVGYINNFIARFWKAPVSAIRISRNILGNDYKSSLSSNYGSTHQVYEPNEFNYFWYDMLSYQDHIQKTDEEAQNIDWDRVAKVIKNILWAFEKPVVFKSFILGWHAKYMQQALKKSCFIWIRRNPTDNALSLLDMRRKLFGTIDKWASFKPINYEFLKTLTPYEQVAGQVYQMEEAYREQLNQLPKTNYLTLQYEEVCKKPQETLRAIKKLINEHEGEVNMQPCTIPSQQPSVKSPENHGDYNKVQQAVQSFYL